MTSNTTTPPVYLRKAHAAAVWVAPRLLLFFGYVLLSRPSIILQTSDLRSTPWNPETGLAVVAGALLGWTAIPVVFLARLAASLIWSPTDLSSWQVLWAAANALIFTGSASLLRDFFRRLTMPGTTTVVAFLGFALLTTTASALARIAIATTALGLSPTSLLPYTTALSVGNLTGILTVAPLFFLWASLTDAKRYFASWTNRQFLVVATTLLATYVVFGLENTNEFKFFYIIFLPVIAMALLEGFAGAAITVILSDVLMLLILYIRGFEPAAAVELQVLMITLSGTGLVLGATVSERQRVVAQLDETYRHLQESQSALYQASRVSLASEMAASLAHDLNQPLTSARNFIRTVRRKLDVKRIDRAALVTNIDSAVEQVDAAAALIRATRQFLEKGDVHRESKSLENILRETTALTSTELARAGITLSFEGNRAIPSVMANATQIQQVLINLIRNAKEAIVEANSVKRQITLSVSTESRPGFAEVTVADTGPGVPEATRPLLFNPVRSGKPEGLGLGLALCKTIVTAHGGELWLDAQDAPGARFCFTLPIAAKRSR